MNLRKDHCRNLHSRTTPRTRLTTGESARAGCSGTPHERLPPSSARAPQRARRATNEPRRGKRQGIPESTACPSRPVRGVRRGDLCFVCKKKRLSATDISALASMKNVAKCDTWCELQNPVNHRVFERKLRPKPLGRGHVCLGVTHRVAPLASRPNHGACCRRGADSGLPCASSSRLA